MLIETLLAVALLSATVEIGTKDPGVLATVRHYSRDSRPQWKATLRTDGPTGPSATYWWIEKQTPEANRPGPGTVEARNVDLTAPVCPAIRRIVAEFRSLEMPEGDIAASGDPELEFVLTPSDGPAIHLTALPRNDPRVRWAHDVRTELRNCIEDRLD